ncbi:MAG: TIGR03905 family TSCPD domain-containing protein [Paludibacteraceae bacterium]|nr:TIGR03905 family TSCPD domain-containing protein [Paludibacteraceae bacterium]
MKYTYDTHGTCSTQIQLDVEGDIIRDVHFVAGCNGNLQGISALVIGSHIDDVIQKLDGIRCGYKSTSCPDQLAQALKMIKSSTACKGTPDCP